MPADFEPFSRKILTVLGPGDNLTVKWEIKPKVRRLCNIWSTETLLKNLWNPFLKGVSLVRNWMIFNYPFYALCERSFTDHTFIKSPILQKSYLLRNSRSKSHKRSIYTEIEVDLILWCVWYLISVKFDKFKIENDFKFFSNQKFIISKFLLVSGNLASSPSFLYKPGSKSPLFSNMWESFGGLLYYQSHSEKPK